MAWTWPWAVRPDGGVLREGKAAAEIERKAGGYGFVALHMSGEASWMRGDYATLSREGFAKNPVVYRAVRMIAEADHE